MNSHWVKSASVFTCLLNIRESFKLVRLSYTSKGKHSLYCADFSLSPCFSFSLPLRALEDCTQTPRNKLGGPQTTHRAGSLSFFSPASTIIPNILVYGHSSFPIFIYPSYFSFLFHVFLHSSPKFAWPLCHVSISTRAICSTLFV